MAKLPGSRGQGPSDHSLPGRPTRTTLPGNIQHLVSPRAAAPQPTTTSEPSASTQPTPYRSLNPTHQQCLVNMDSSRDRIITKIISNPVGQIINTILLINRSVVNSFVIVALCFVFLLARWPYSASIVLTLVTFGLLSHLILVSSRTASKRLQTGGMAAQTPHYTFIVCGSGGHTGEMIRMVERSIRPTANSHRRWAVGFEDHMSFNRVMECENRLGRRFEDVGTFDIVCFHRGRAVQQSWLTTPFTALASFLHLGSLLVGPPACRDAAAFRFPRVIISDGPGTGFLVFLAAHLLKVFAFVPEGTMQTLFVESWARVSSLSLSGKLIYYLGLADLFIVQHRRLAELYKVTFAGRIACMPKPT
ncbi:glycosyltransferase family 1 protein [Durotheca rogersii]|uniref:glycosyltransferase family 1 protein n=1 Tax=Durotheca rogersii TaxID=419775 RepID=UPI002220B4D4|nr:glycosyltransferase family 1 protein [Durotheca rogersii]KAI5864332.1 glycosyltransferase family 1 protein [Durotheca rogersii]